MAPIPESQDGDETTSGSEDEGGDHGHDTAAHYSRIEVRLPLPNAPTTIVALLLSSRDRASIPTRLHKQPVKTFVERLRALEAYQWSRIPRRSGQCVRRVASQTGGWLTDVLCSSQVWCGRSNPKCPWSAVLRKLSRGKDEQGHPLPDKWLVDVVNGHHEHGLEVAPVPTAFSPSTHELFTRSANASKVPGHDQVIDERMAFSPSRLANQAATHRHAPPAPPHHQGPEAPFYPASQVHETSQYGYNAGRQRGGRASMLPATQPYAAHSQATPAPATPRDAGEMSLPQQVLSSVIATNGSSEDLLEKLQTIIDLQKANQQPFSQASAAQASHPDLHGSPPRRDYDESRVKSTYRSSCCHDIDIRGAAAGPSRYEDARDSNSRRRRREDDTSSDDHHSYSSPPRRHRGTRGGRAEREKKRRRAERERSDYWSPGRSQDDPRRAASSRDRHHHDERGRHNERHHGNDVYYPDDYHGHSIRPKEERHHDSHNHHYRDDNDGRRGRRGSPYKHHGEDRRARSPSLAPRRRHNEQH